MPPFGRALSFFSGLGLGAADGRAALSAWMRRRAARAGKILAVEEALLSGTFYAYAGRRLAAFVLSRSWGTALHVLELTWLAQVFSARPFVASLAFQNVALVVDAFFFGALESMRRRARHLGATPEAAALVSRWLSFAILLGVVAGLGPGVRALWVWGDHERPPSLLHLYAIVCGLRLGADVVLRTYYSGVFAHHRVYRPVWLPVVPPTILVLGTVGAWRFLGGYAFVAALAASVLVSRGMLFVYTRRAYRLRRVPAPRWRLVPRLGGGHVTLEMVGEALLAGSANTVGRIGAVVLVAAIIPSLSQAPPESEEDAILASFAFALHLAAPLLFVAGQWWLVFYHDWKRLEEDAADALAAVLHQRILVVAIVLGVFAWLTASALVTFFVPLERTWITLLTLAPAVVGLSVWTAFQLRGFVRGEFVRQAASAAALVAVAALTASSEWLGDETWFVALAAGPWFAVLVAWATGLVRRRHATGLVDSLATWVTALGAQHGEVEVWFSRVTMRPLNVAERIVEKLGDRGAVVVLGSRIVWFEHAPFTPRDAWLALGAGTMRRLSRCAKGPARAQRRALEAEGLLRAPEPAELGELARAHARIFPEGFVVEVGRRPPPAFAALSAVDRQAIWRDAVRALRGSRSRSGWMVTAYAPRGTAEVLYVAKRPVRSKEATEWASLLSRATWRFTSTES